MKALLAELGDPQLAYPAVHVVGTNGKSTATVTIEQLLLAEGLSVGATLSPHVRSWSERIRIDGHPADLPAALARVRPAAERVNATQFETITAAAFAAFADAHVDVAVIEAGLGGRYDGPTWSTRASFFSPTSGSSTPTCSARRSRRLLPKNLLLSIMKTR